MSGTSRPINSALHVSGAEVMSLANNDENKTFGVMLRTPVENSKGIPHILEHSVLCGSRKYPIKVSTQRHAAISVMHLFLASTPCFTVR